MQSAASLSPLVRRMLGYAERNCSCSKTNAGTRDRRASPQHRGGVGLGQRGGRRRLGRRPCARLLPVRPTGAGARQAGFGAGHRTRRGRANGLSSIATAVPLRWGDALPPAEQLPGQPLEVVLASDVLYQAEALPLFIRTLCQVFAANPEACLILCIEHRPALPFPAALFAAAGLRGRRLPTAEQHPEWRSDDIHLFCIQLAAAASGGHGQQQAASGSSNDSDR